MFTNFLLILSLLILFNILIKKYINLAFNYKILSIPKFRDSHNKTKPKGAGIVFFFIFVIYIFYNIAFVEIDFFYTSLLFSIPLITLFSFLDDVYDVNWKYKIIIDIITSVIIIYIFTENIQSVAFENYKYFLLPILVLMITWFINLINFTDGSDGYLVIFALLNILINILTKYTFGIEVYNFNLLFIFTMFIFLYYNFYKSSVFLGDSGSRLIAVIMIINIFYDLFYYDNVLLLIWTFTLSIVLVDTGLTLLQRLIINRKMLQEHKDHAYQILANKFNHKISLIWILLNFLFLIIPSIYLYLNNIFDYLFIFLLLNFFLLSQIVYIKLKYK